MKAIGSRILVENISSGEKIKYGNFEVPQSDYETVKILSVGEEIKSIHEGETALIYPGAGKNFIYEGKNYRVISINEVIVVF